MDEYDASVNHALMNFKNDDEITKILSLFSNLNEETFKGNENQCKGLLTGVLRVTKASILSGLNNLIEYNINEN